MIGACAIGERMIIHIPLACMQADLILQQLQGVANRLVSWILPVRCPRNGFLYIPWTA